MSDDHTCEATYEWVEGKDGKVNFSDKESIPVSLPEVFGGDGNKVNPEEMLAGSVVSCTAVTLMGVLRRAGAPVDAVESFDAETEGTYGKTPDGLNFKEFVIKASFVVETGGPVDELRRKLKTTDVNCIVEKTLNVDVRLESEVHEA